MFISPLIWLISTWLVSVIPEFEHTIRGSLPCTSGPCKFMYWLAVSESNVARFLTNFWSHRRRRSYPDTEATAPWRSQAHFEMQRIHKAAWCIAVFARPQCKQWLGHISVQQAAMSAFPESGRSNTAKTAEIRGRFRPIPDIREDWKLIYYYTALNFDRLRSCTA